MIATFLDFNHAAGAESVGLACAVRCLMTLLLDQFRQVFFLAVAQGQVDAFRLIELFDGSVGIAANGDDRRISASRNARDSLSA